MKREHKATMAQPDPNSKRSKRRKARGFKSLAISSRKHRRAFRRNDIGRTVGANHNGSGGTCYEPGMTVDPPVQGKIKTFAAHAAGSYDFHAT